MAYYTARRMITRINHPSHHDPFFLPCDSDVLFCYTMSARLCLFISFLPRSLMPDMLERSDNIFCEIRLKHNVTKLGTLIMINYDSLE